MMSHWFSILSLSSITTECRELHEGSLILHEELLDTWTLKVDKLHWKESGSTQGFIVRWYECKAQYLISGPRFWQMYLEAEYDSVGHSGTVETKLALKPRFLSWQAQLIIFCSVIAE